MSAGEADESSDESGDRALRDALERFEALVESTPLVAVQGFDRQGRILHWNAASTALYGFTRQEVIGRRLQDVIIEPGGLAAFEAELDEVWSTGRASTPREWQVRIRSGEPRWVYSTMLPTLASGSVQEVFCMDVDLTSRKRAEQALRDSEARYRSLVTALSDGVVMVDRETRIVACNASAERILALPAGQLIGLRLDQSDWSSVHEDGSPFLSQDFPVLKALRTGQPQSDVVMGLPRPDGRMLWISINSQPVYLDTGDEPSAAVASFTDITERKRAEETARAALVRFEEIVENTPLVAIKGFDRAGVILHWNSACAALLGYEKHEALGARYQELLGDPGHVRELERALELAWTTGQASVPCEWEARTKGGGRRFLYSSLFPVIEDGRVVEVFAMDVDISDRKRAEEARRRLEAKLQHAQKLESLGVLAGGIAHDFNNLLTGILGYADLALLEMPPLSPARDNVLQMVVTARRAADLTRQLLAYSGRGRFVIEPMVLSELVRSMRGLLEVSISKKCTLQYRLADDEPAIDADATQLRQVVMNLVINASEALGERGGVILVSTGVAECDRALLSETFVQDELPEGRYVYLEVEDKGCGMPPPVLGRLFEPFFTTKFTGRGLGLAAVLGIVRGHHGAVRVRSETERGTTFTVYLPTSSAAVPADVPPSPAPGPWAGSGAILVVDDEETVLALAARMLARAGLQVITARDGFEALESFRIHGQSIRAILLDLTMPRMDGEETLRELRRIDPAVPVILSSGYNEQDVTQRLRDARPAGFVQKPYSYDELVAAVRAVLEPR
jgi:two-component system, cell cycle sensor histidine kinase and response regulator CckA